MSEEVTQPVMIKNPQMVQMICMPIIASFLTGHQKHDELPIHLQNLLRQCTNNLAETIQEIPLIDKKFVLGPNNPAPTGAQQGKQPCAGCK